MTDTTKVIVFDPFSGASGDMILGSLLDLGANRDRVISAIEKAAQVKVTISRTLRGIFRATRVEIVPGPVAPNTYTQVVEQIRSAGLPSGITDDALGILEIMGRAEAHVHGTTLDELHLHEMGQQDAIADIVGVATAFHSLGPVRVYCMPVSVGGGMVDTEHGRLPVPAPATLGILNQSSLMWRGGPVEHELLTPTGAAVLAYLTTTYGSPVTVYPQLVSTAAGYGAGSLETTVPNVLRTVLGELDAALVVDHIEMLETNVDDVTGEVLGYLIQELMDQGALDVSVIPATMKKGRSGSLVKVVCRARDSHRLARRIMVETGSLGVRLIPVRHRLSARRRMMEVQISVQGTAYRMGVKVASDTRGEILNLSPEFEDCKSVAQRTGLPLKNIMDMVLEAARTRIE